MDTRNQPIQYDANTWLIMREHPTRPKAVVKRVTDRTQMEKYLLLTWDPEPTKWRLHHLYDTLEAAALEVKWSNPRPETPKHPGYPAPLTPRTDDRRASPPPKWRLR